MPSAIAYKAHVLAELSLEAGMTVVDVGCGPGTDLREAAARVVPGGSVIGIDLDQHMLATAADRIGTGVSLMVADAHELPLRSASIDRLRTDRSFQHMRDPHLGLGEFRRVLRDRGVAVLAEPDWRTFVIDGGDSAVAERFVDYTCREVVRNATVGRAIPRLGHETGFETRRVVAFPTVIREMAQADKVFGLTRNVRAATDAGFMTKTAADKWLSDLHGAPMLAAVTLFVTTLFAVA